MLSLSWSGKQIVSFICHVITLTIEHQQHFSVASQTLWTNQTWQTEGNQTPCPYCLTKTSLSWGLIRKTHFLKFKIFADRKYNTSLPVFLHLQTMNLHCSLQQFKKWRLFVQPNLQGIHFHIHPHAQLFSLETAILTKPCPYKPVK